MNNRVIKEHFWNTGVDGDVRLTKDNLGWPDMLMQEAMSDYPETIFRHCIEIVGLNILFYWIRDENFYTIETEKDPIVVRRIALDPEWDGKCVISISSMLQKFTCHMLICGLASIFMRLKYLKIGIGLNVGSMASV